MKTNLSINIARDEYGKDLSIDLSKTKHLLIAGRVGSGKSNLLHKIISTLIVNNTENELRLIFIDTKKVEFSVYNRIPHNLTPVIADPKKAIMAMKWLGKEIHKRYEFLKNSNCRHISEYQGSESMPHIVTVIDEFADLVQIYPKETKLHVLSIIEMGHSVGVSLILSTSKPGPKVLTKDIRNGIGSHIALQTVSKKDSNVVIGNSDAFTLHGAGDMLYRDGMKYVIRGQVELVDHDEITKLCNSLQVKSERDNPMWATEEQEEDLDDDLYEQAKEITLQVGKVSTSYIQRKLRIGYSRAARLMDLLEKNGVIGPAEGAEPRIVLS